MTWIMACCVLDATIAAEKVQDELSFVAVAEVFGFRIVFFGAEESQEVFGMDSSSPGWLAVMVDGSAIGGVVLDVTVGAALGGGVGEWL
jgi:hypothetical protein